MGRSRGVGVLPRVAVAAAALATVALATVGLASCGAPGSVQSSGASLPARQDALVCGDDLLQSAVVALEEGAGFPDEGAAVADAQATGWLPVGEAELPTAASRGLVRVGSEVVAEFTIEEVGSGRYHVTSVDTCYRG